MKRTHIRDADVCGADINKHEACAIGAQRGISAFFPPSPTLPLHSFHLLGKKIKNNATVLWSNRRQGNNNDELSCGERSRLMTKQEHSGIPLQARCLPRPLRIMQCGRVKKEPLRGREVGCKILSHVSTLNARWRREKMPRLHCRSEMLGVGEIFKWL